MAKTSPVSVRLSPELLEEIEREARRTARPTPSCCVSVSEPLKKAFTIPFSWRGSKSGNRVAPYGLTISEVSSAAFALA